MTEHEITQIAVGGHRVGIIGLKPALEAVAGELAGRPEVEIKAALMENWARTNLYRPLGRCCVRSCIFREYKKFIGESIAGRPGRTDPDQGAGARLPELRQA